MSGEFDLDSFEAELKSGVYDAVIKNMVRVKGTKTRRLPAKPVVKLAAPVVKPIENNDVPTQIVEYIRESTCRCGHVHRLHTADMIKYVNGLQVYYKPVTIANKKDADLLRHLEPATMVTKETILSCNYCNEKILWSE